MKIFYLTPSHRSLAGFTISVVAADYDHACFKIGKAYPETDYTRLSPVMNAVPVSENAYRSDRHVD